MQESEKQLSHFPGLLLSNSLWHTVPSVTYSEKPNPAKNAVECELPVPHSGASRTELEFGGHRVVIGPFGSH